MAVITLTLSPAYDIHAYCDTFASERENHVRMISRDAGGKGLNISRALAEYGIKSTALIILGEENSADFENSVFDEGITVCAIKTRGRIRENLTVHTKDGKETRISFDGSPLDSSVIGELRKRLTLRRGDVLTVTGSIPAGINIESLKEYLFRLKDSGVKTVIDSRSLALSDISDIKPWLIKPNAEEISKYLGREIYDVESAIEAARQISEVGAENAIISLGEMGAVLSADGRIFVGRVPKIDTVSTIGAGDSMIAGFIAAAQSEYDISEAFIHALAFGSAACLSEGSLPPTKSNIQELIKKVEIFEED